ncbi:MAG: DUF2834 domain-containing protein [Deltaproteobacteria bacterium]|jgi:hypothetical protein|nr:DUF2834 domain-containing protein [Deltaproteobacteria bacterium]
MPRAVLIAILIPFSALTAAAVWHHGYWGIVAPHLQSLAGGQVLADLVIALTLVMTWMWRDARTMGRNPWPWIVVTLGFGSFGPLFYLLTRPSQGGER